MSAPEAAKLTFDVLSARELADSPADQLRIGTHGK